MVTMRKGLMNDVEFVGDPCRNSLIDGVWSVSKGVVCAFSYAID